ncbi:hypothetical protein E2562_026731 [Oryza meyeriana var. granulata]|uniref:Uncharacterized protein n=1 Tax=Oryza meyeriana var. granulata TaxID=110450 RepID=A0A6G1EZC4_9ORYZ|nr:hypothetical protein E2562_026731 [Oryza meyeriana var. granulata]
MAMGMSIRQAYWPFDTVIGNDPKQEYYKSVNIAGASHIGVVSDEADIAQQQNIVGEQRYTAEAVDPVVGDNRRSLLDSIVGG